MPKNYVVRFQPEGKEAIVDEESSVFDAACEADIHIDSECGGLGDCGKCKVAVRRGEYYGGASSLLTEDDVRKGLVLACLAIAGSDLEVLVPEQSRLGARKR